jgi:DNA-binding CsgD family transcriptional regulator
MKSGDRSGERRDLLVSEIYRAVFGAAPIKHALRELAALTDSDRAIWGHFDPQRNTKSVIDSYNFSPDFIQKYNSKTGPQNPWLTKSQYFQAEGLIWRGSRIIPSSELVTTRFYSEFLAPQRIHHTLHIVISVSAERVTHVILTRPEHQPDYSDVDFDVARWFAFHARQAAESHRVIEKQTIIRAGLAEVVEDAALGVAILEPPAVIYTSETCDRILASLGAPVNSRKGSVAPHSAVVHFPRAVAEAINTHHNGSAKRLIINRTNGSGCVLVNIKALNYQSPALPEYRRVLIVSFFDLTQKVPIDEDLLQNTYDLTASEVRVCSLLANNETVESVAEKLRISTNTARTHIKRIFSKTGSSRQSDLVKLIMNAATLHRNGKHLELADSSSKVGEGSHL